MTIPLSEFENLHEQIRLLGEMIEKLKRLLDDQTGEVRKLRTALRELQAVCEAGIEDGTHDGLFRRLREWVRAQGSGGSRGL
jgi:hypothetical protein